MQKYKATRKNIENYIRSKDHWPDGLTHPDSYRAFYWKNDLTMCGFATADHHPPTEDVAT